MAKRDDDSTAATGTGAATGSTVDSMEQKMLAFAEQLGRIVGTVQAKAEGWLDRDALQAQISGVRDSASNLLDQLGGGVAKAVAVTRQAADSASSASRSMRKAAGRPGNTAGAKGKGAAKAKIPAKGKVASKVKASATSGAATAKSARQGPQRRRRGCPRKKTPQADAERVGRNRRATRRRLAESRSSGSAARFANNSGAAETARVGQGGPMGRGGCRLIPIRRRARRRRRGRLRDPDTRTLHGLQQTSQSWTKLPFTSGSR